MFRSLTFDSLLSCESRDVFTGFLAPSVQELWLFKSLPATIAASAREKVFFVTPGTL